MYQELSAPINVQWELTPWCPNTCIYCYNYWRPASRNGSLRLTNEDCAIHRAAAEELVNSKVFHVTLTGGEPLGAIRKYAPYIRAVSEAGLQVTMNTTLLLLTPTIADLLIELGIKSLLVSLASSEEPKHDELVNRVGAFEKTVNNIRMAIDWGFNVTLNMVVTKANVHSVRETGKFASELGATAFCATKASTPCNCPDFAPYRLSMKEFHNVLFDLLWIRNTYGISIDSLEHYPACSFPNSETRSVFGFRGCMAGKTGATIGFDGGVRPCSHAPISYGDIRNGLQLAWSAMRQWRDDSLIPTNCKESCTEYVSGRCGGGCRIDAYVAGGQLDSPDMYCTGTTPTTARLSKPNPTVYKDARYRLRQNVVHRKEAFGYILYFSPSKWAAVDEQMFALLDSSRNDSSIHVSTLAERFGVSENTACQSLGYLLSKNLLQVC